jgi:hypothetical protein
MKNVEESVKFSKDRRLGFLYPWKNTLFTEYVNLRFLCHTYHIVFAIFIMLRISVHSTKLGMNAETQIKNMLLTKICECVDLNLGHLAGYQQCILVSLVSVEGHFVFAMYFRPWGTDFHGKCYLTSYILEINQAFPQILHLKSACYSPENRMLTFI